jgi:hypothetical protein
LTLGSGPDRPERWEFTDQSRVLVVDRNGSSAVSEGPISDGQRKGFPCEQRMVAGPSGGWSKVVQLVWFERTQETVGCGSGAALEPTRPPQGCTGWLERERHSSPSDDGLENGRAWPSAAVVHSSRSRRLPAKSTANSGRSNAAGWRRDGLRACTVVLEEVSLRSRARKGVCTIRRPQGTDGSEGNGSS